MSATSRAFAAIATASCTHLPSSCLRVAVGLQRSDLLLERLDGISLRGFNLGETRFKRRFLGLESCLLGFEGRDPGLLLCDVLRTGLAQSTGYIVASEYDCGHLRPQTPQK